MREPNLCGRVMVGQGDDTYDPVCVLAVGHEGLCASPVEQPQEDKRRWKVKHQGEHGWYEISATGPEPLCEAEKVTVVPESELQEAKKRIAEIERERDDFREYGEQLYGRLAEMLRPYKAEIESLTQPAVIVPRVIERMEKAEEQLQEALDLLEADVLPYRGMIEFPIHVFEWRAFLHKHGRLTEGDSQ